MGINFSQNLSKGLIQMCLELEIYLDTLKLR